MFQLVEGILAKHDQAVKTEAAALNAAISQEEQAFQEIFNAANSGKATPIDASSAIDQVVGGYDTLVYSNYKVKRKAGNGADVIKSVVQNWGTEAKQLLQSPGGGTLVTHYLPPHAGFSGTASMNLTYNPPNVNRTGVGNVLQLPQGTLTTFGGTTTPIVGSVGSQIGTTLQSGIVSAESAIGASLPSLSGIGSNIMIGLAVVVIVIIMMAIMRK